jgi:hypothetical protein
MSWAEGTLHCCACGAQADGVDVPCLPAGWDALFVAGQGWMTFCAGCADCEVMEMTRASRAWPRRKSWAYPGGIMGVLRPAAREVLLATPDGMAVLSEEDAIRLRDALDGALAMRAQAETMAGGLHAAG